MSGSAGGRASARPAAAARGPRPVSLRPRGGSGADAHRARRYRALKWALLAALAVYAVLVVRANSARNVDFSVIRQALAEAPGLEALHELDENALLERLESDCAGCEGWVMYGADEIMNVSEVLAAKGDEAALNEAQDAVEGRLKRQLAVFAAYGTDQKELLEGATVLRRGNYLFYAVGPDARAWEDAFLSAIR